MKVTVNPDKGTLTLESQFDPEDHTLCDIVDALKGCEFRAFTKSGRFLKVEIPMNVRKPLTPFAMIEDLDIPPGRAALRA